MVQRQQLTKIHDVVSTDSTVVHYNVCVIRNTVSTYTMTSTHKTYPMPIVPQHSTAKNNVITENSQFYHTFLTSNRFLSLTTGVASTSMPSAIVG